MVQMLSDCLNYIKWFSLYLLLFISIIFNKDIRWGWMRLFACLENIPYFYDLRCFIVGAVYTYLNGAIFKYIINDFNMNNFFLCIHVKHNI